MKHEPLFIIFGATGDLAKKKIIPAIYELYEKKKIDNFAIICIGRRELKINELIDKSKQYIKRIDEKKFNTFIKKCTYFQMNFDEQEKYHELSKKIKEIEKEKKMDGDRIFYLSTSPQAFKTIAQNLKHADLNLKKGCYNRVVFEKPFGENLESSKEINKVIKKIFPEESIYRIDHYLGKEMIQNIASLRFTNKIIESLWNKENIDHVQITLTEDFGIADRGGFYDSYGAVKDVVQNHMMQLLALVAMRAPKELSGKYIRDEKIRILKKTNIEDFVLGQYEGYTKETSVKKDSTTETFAAIKMNIDEKNWKGIPFYFLTGKNLKDRLVKVYIQFKRPPCIMFDGVCTYSSNALIIQIQPNDGFFLKINAKKPESMEIEPIKLNFSYENHFGPNTPEAYSNLIHDVIKGDQTSFIRSDEIEEEWRIIDCITKTKKKPEIYKKGTMPKKAQDFIKKDKRIWKLKVHEQE